MISRVDSALFMNEVLLFSHDILPEELEDTLADVVASEVVGMPRKIHLLEVLVMLHKLGNDLEGRSWVDIVIKLSVDKEKLALEPPSIVDI